ncbi:hypothetical protein A2634_05540 [Candidatus Amesbacteria bacterium RIFCSPHIGHO2_01_FULL_48_32]|uniref:O-antigen ligase-related domain-containing protein n=1 Tax=Candidatus Amesbacteria bacterium RIFCSPLOWO2_01_FULL_48_25 TaxID=1797259 RepID=A0A1F4ZAJ7_9BACT|nr:MAG: hypothetical protein A2634_05540 [Candidatus Amesbacteria bacterium RIFCSPHIGHO2_01_FULL_48_32]OGD03410.1 MAG: hypothetical protein A2989_01085 [Candidatus Amesbacteria bacterium RIFCSPLOWO2_01_FULL_48_25]HJZ05026.1 O-antigen ligase family protein [Patescibacteria group bacterium]
MILFLLVLLLPSQLALHLWPSWSLVNGLRVDYLSPTLYFTDILILAMVLISRQRIKIPFWAIIFVVLNILISQSPFIALYKWLRVLEYFWIFKYLTFEIDWKLKIVNWSLSASVIWTSLLAWLQFFKQGSLGGLLYWLGERRFDITTPGIAKIAIDGRLTLRPYATLPHPNALAGFLLVSGLIVIYLITSPHPSPESGEGARGRGLACIAIVLAALTIPLTFSRTAILFEAALLVTWLLFKIKSLKLKISLAISSTLLLFFSSTLIPGNPSSLSERLFLIGKSITLIKNHPVLGVGLGNFIPSPYHLFAMPYSLSSQPVHNIYLLLASELGLPALLVIGYWIIENYLLAKRDQWIEIENRKLKIPLLVILITGAADHYWVTLHQNTLLLTILMSLIYIQSKNLSTKH